MAVVHTDWSTPALDLPPVAPAVGPFPRRPFLRTVADHAPGGTPFFVESEHGLLALAADGDRVTGLGIADLVDYRSPLGDDGVEAGVALGAALDGRSLVLDSLPAEAAEPLAKGLEAVGLAPAIVDDTIAAVLDLPGDLDAYLAEIGKKERHELRRKRRRLVAMLGEPRIESHDTPDAGFDWWIATHRRAPGAKGGFMTAAMEAYFKDLLTLDGWRLDLLVTDVGPVAGVFGYVDEDGYFLYNSAYDPDHAEASPGQVLLGELIARCIEEGLGRFDFLKGDERYKFRLGAHARTLFCIEVAGTGAGP